MKDRIKQFMLNRGMTQKALASELCISEATLTGIFTGRTRPTVNIIDAFHQFFPEVNMYWLMYGEGDMFNNSEASDQACESEAQVDESPSSDPFQQSVRPSSQPSAAPAQDHRESAQHPDIFGQPMQQAYPYQQVQQPMMQPHIIEKYLDKPQRKITEIRIFFDDGTYETFTP